jgi:hypothetical protein
VRPSAFMTRLWIFVNGLLLLVASVPPAYAAKNSAPAQVTMIATMPATFALQAGSGTVVGASGTVQTQATGRGELLVRGQLLGHGNRAVLHIPISLAANTRSFVVHAQMQETTGHAIVSLNAPGLMARSLPMRSQRPLAMGIARNHGREFFALNQPLHSVLEIVVENLPAGQTSNFALSLTMRDLAY